MHLADIARGVRAHERIDLHDLRPNVPELARHTGLAAAPRFLVRRIRIIKLLPQPAPRAGEDARDVRAQSYAREKVAIALAVIGHADRDIDPGAIERTRKRVRDVAVKENRTPVAVDGDGDPALGKPVEADRNQPRFSSLKKSLPLSSMMMKAGKSTTSMRQIASMPSSGYSTTSTFLMQCSARFAAAPPIEPR
ncbi:hypothetical protein ACVIM8_005470 [Bradyrhizobium sp. USDA 4529]